MKVLVCGSAGSIGANIAKLCSTHNVDIEMIEEAERGIEINKLLPATNQSMSIALVPHFTDIKDGKQLMRERRKQNRKTK
jgi:FlaA1/EpsC-like NDP-sugar epimerase